VYPGEKAVQPGETPVEFKTVAMGVAPDGIPTVSFPKAAPIIPPTIENFVCLAGCRYYCDVLVEAPDSNLENGRSLIRYCKWLSTAQEPMELTESNVFACAQFSPPWWSRLGRAVSELCRERLRVARQRVTDAACSDDDDDEEVAL
jgi:exonuclease VII small subunit